MRGEMINQYEKLNSEDQKVFRRWLWVNAVTVAILLAGLIAFAVNVPDDKSETTDQHATIHKLLAQSGPLSHPAVRARDVVRRRIDLDDALVALGPIDGARFCRTDTW